MFINSFDVDKTRRLAVGLLACSGAMLFTSYGLVGAGISAGDREFAKAASSAIMPLMSASAFAFGSLVCAEIADHKDTPEEGHPHSKENYLQTALVLTGMLGVGNLVWGSLVLMGKVLEAVNAIAGTTPLN